MFAFAFAFVFVFVVKNCYRSRPVFGITLFKRTACNAVIFYLTNYCFRHYNAVIVTERYMWYVTMNGLNKLRNPNAPLAPYTNC